MNETNERREISLGENPVNKGDTLTQVVEKSEKNVVIHLDTSKGRKIYTEVERMASSPGFEVPHFLEQVLK